ncbi:FAD binding domain-containing protein [Alkalicoccobacillus plakortidis]|uniref:FAD binding domain-containing protein n=1 Tax=Alkalicoccobacillus plakortidis TaxID=444060 RepID=A0ABT0XII2_9BACI|nr:FAD binding domain-containing protein [Alkalicoccobacillus plakortidis]MCM2675667.1 FAD binding domain-containing protein [Alkalicoccobacillus plakortidis]
MEQMMPKPVSVWLPKTIEEAWQYKERFGTDAEYVAGGTLIQVKREKQGVLAPYLISLQQISEQQNIREDVEGEMLNIGAGVTLSECLGHPLLTKRAPFLLEAISSIGAPAIRNQGTIGGNVAYGIGDTLMVLLAKRALVKTFSNVGYKTQSLEDYLTEKSPSILVSIHLPFMDQTSRSAWLFKKIGRREAFIPSTVSIALYLSWNEANECEQARLVVAGGENTPQRLESCEQRLIGSTLKTIHLPQLKKQLKEEISLAGDEFTSETYRVTVAANILHQGLSDVFDAM